MHELTPGEILLGKYRVEEVIGIGGMGRVIKAGHLYLQQPVAIKILLPEMAESQSTVARFLREAQSTVKLRSEHIARVMDVGTMHDGTPFMVMEFLEGHDLNQILRHHGPQQPQAVVDLILQACEGMAEAHSIGIVHRDIKPSNFFVTRRPDGSDLLKILDFGISKTPAEITELTGTQTVIGTPTYMAPEQMMSARATDPRSDIWSIGVVMYQMLAGRPPFEAETYAQLVIKVGTAPPEPLHVQLPPGLGAIVLRCLEKEPENRIQSVGELARVLAPYASDPASAQQSADRSARILLGPRASHGNMAFGGSTGNSGLPLTPPALTPRSWSQTNGSSGAGQLGAPGTKLMRGSRSLIIAGVATLCVLAGVGGFMMANGMNGPDATTTAAAAGSAEPGAAARKAQSTKTAAALEDTPSAPSTVSIEAQSGSAAVTASGSAAPAVAKVDTTVPPGGTAPGGPGTSVDTNAKTDAKTDATTDAKTDATTDATTDAKTDAKTVTTKADTKTTKSDTKTTKTTKSTKAETKSTKSTKSTKTAKSETKSTGTKAGTKGTTATKTGDSLFDNRK